MIPLHHLFLLRAKWTVDGWCSAMSKTPSSAVNLTASWIPGGYAFFHFDRSLAVVCFWRAQNGSTSSHHPKYARKDEQEVPPLV